MIITCPNCGSTFNFPEEKIRPETRVRCSVCSHVFRLVQGMPGALDNPFLAPKAPPSADADAAPLSTGKKSAAGRKKKPKKAAVIAAVILVLLIVAGSGYYLFFRDATRGSSRGEITAEERALQLQDILIDKRRQYISENRYLGNIIVIDGQVTNGGEHPKNFIKLEASIIAPDGTVLMSKQFYCGPVVKQSQLETMGEMELEKWLTNEVEIFRTNTNVPPGGHVPFMVVFYRPTEGMLNDAERYSFRLTAMDAQEVRPKDD